MKTFEDLRMEMAKRPFATSILSLFLGMFAERKGWIFEAVRAIFIS